MKTNIILCLLNIAVCIWTYSLGWHFVAAVNAFTVGFLAALIFVEYYEASRAKKGNQTHE